MIILIAAFILDSNTATKLFWKFLKKLISGYCSNEFHCCCCNKLNALRAYKKRILIVCQDFPSFLVANVVSDFISQGNQASSITFATEETSFSVRRRNFPFLGIHSRERKSANLFTFLAPKSQFQITFTFTICGALTKCTAAGLSRCGKLKRPSVYDQTFAWVSSSKLIRDRE